jgi:hypothetical protein
VPTLLLPTITTRFMTLHPTFLRARLFQYLQASYSRETFCGSLRQTDMQKVPRAFVEGLTEAVSYTAKWLKSSSETVRKVAEWGLRRILCGTRQGKWDFLCPVLNARRTLVLSYREFSDSLSRILGE